MTTKITKPAAKRRAFVADVRFLLWTGETHVETIARRCGTNPRALEARLTRAGRVDLLRRMTGRIDSIVKRSEVA